MTTSQRVLLGFAIAAILAGPIGMAAFADFESDGARFNGMGEQRYQMAPLHNQMAPMHNQMMPMQMMPMQNGMNYGDGMHFSGQTHPEGPMGGMLPGS